MLKDNVDIKLISKYTDKSIEEIKKIEESIHQDFVQIRDLQW